MKTLALIQLISNIFNEPTFSPSVDVTEEDSEELLKKAASYVDDPVPTKFCDNCGTILTGDSSICPSCGEPID